MTIEPLRADGNARRGPRRPTSTASFGSSRRESHDASGFYDRFVPPVLSSDETLARPDEVDVVHLADARTMDMIAAGSIALVVTSPPYFAGKEYEESLGANGVPSSYLEYLELLADVFAECRRVLEPGGRIAVNVANLGRRPYRSLSGDVTQILCDLGLLLRGEIVWWKGRAAGGSCAWGTFQQPANPVLRDVTERVVVASKGRFDRAIGLSLRSERGLPSNATITRDEFLDATTDLWEIPSESARRVGHPAPFPVELPQRLIELYTYEDDVVLDPFMGSGTTGVAAVRCGRRFVGFETEESYHHLAEQRIAAERTRRSEEAKGCAYDVEEAVAGARRQGVQAKELAGELLAAAGFTDIVAGARTGVAGLTVSFAARDSSGAAWAFDVVGGFTCVPSGLRRGDSLWRALGRAAVLHERRPAMPFVLLTTDLPATGGSGAAALGTLTGDGRPVRDVVPLLDPRAVARLRAHCRDGSASDPA
jgi:DNA modification methylase